MSAESPRQAENEKKPVPQIDEVSGLSGDYNNAFKNFLGYNPERMDECLEWFIDDVKSELAKNPSSLLIQKYTERYPSTSYQEVVTEKNKEDIEYIDVAVGKIQQFYQERIRPHLGEVGGLEPEVKRDIIALVKEVNVLMKRIANMIEGEIMVVPNEDTPLNTDYLKELSPLSATSSADKWYAIIQEKIKAQDGMVVPMYVDREDIIAGADPISKRRQKRIQRINGIAASLNRSLADMEETVKKTNVDMVVRSVRPLFLRKAAIIERMIKAEAA